MEEEIIDIIPRVVIPADIIDEECSLVITDRRSMFVRVKSHSDALTDAFLGGILLAAVGEWTARKRYLTDRKIDPETLAQIVDTTVIWHSSLSSIEIRKSLNRYYLELEYRDARSRPRTLSSRLAPPSALLKRREKEGMRRVSVVRQYAAKVRAAYDKALSTEVLQRASWEV